MAPRRRGDVIITSEGVTFPRCFGNSQISLVRLGTARRVWPPTNAQATHPSLGVAALVNATRLRACAAKGDFLKMKGSGGGSGSGSGSESDSGSGKDDDDAVTKLIDRYGDSLGQLGFGGVLGFCSGYAMIKVGKTVAFVIGISFLVCQGINRSGVVDIKWANVEEHAKKLLDTNKDNKVDKEDVKALWKRLKKVLTHNLPAGGGFAGGFALGMCCG